MVNKKVIVALDYNKFSNIENLLNKIKDKIFGIKIGYEFFYNFGLEGYNKIEKQNTNIFLDLKLHDIPNTVKNGIKAIANLNPYFTSIHIAGGDKMMQEAVDNKKNTKILGISVLTSFNNNQVKKYYARENVNTLINEYAKCALENNLDGIVCSPHEIQRVRNIVGNNLIIVTPGIRPAYYQKADDQKRFMTPMEAIKLGADYLVIGRPITESTDPLNEINRINIEIEKY